MHTYEIALILSEKLEEEARQAAITQVQDYVTRFGGTVTKVDEWGRKRLAYKIDKMNEGYYYFISVQGGSELPNELEHNLRIMEPVIRYLVVRKDA